ncbi:MAG: Uma2 family endonuclease [Candidatus Latescibacteria bacterium]|nr:Uma2 family endonuclease [Candidatus Latescibacterota bacterium]
MWERKQTVEALTRDREAGQAPVVLQLRPVLELTDEQLYGFSQLNRDLRIERNAEGELVIMPPTGGETGRRNAEITVQLGVWARSDGTGVIFDSSTGFHLPNGAVRSPDVAWVRRTQLASLSVEQRQQFTPLCPDFVIELRSNTDSLSLLQGKMQEYLDNGAQLCWLIDPEQRRVHVYRPGVSVEVMENPEAISGAPMLAGFSLDLRQVW